MADWEDLCEMIFEQKSQGSEGISHSHTGRKSLPGRGNSKGKVSRHGTGVWYVLIFLFWSK